VRIGNFVPMSGSPANHHEKRIMMIHEGESPESQEFVRLVLPRAHHTG